MNYFDQLEQMRLRARNSQITAIALVGGGVVMFLLFPLLGIPLFVAGVITLLVSNTRCVKPFAKAYKEQMVKGLLAETIDDLRFYPDKGISKEVVKSTDMMSLGNIYRTNDLIEGAYNGVRFSQSDILIQQQTSNGKNTTTTTYLQGRWLIFDFNKRFHCDLQVRDRKFSYAKKSGGWFSDREKTEKLETESEVFNDTFKVYAENESEAFYILTPHFMEALMQVKLKAGGQVLFCFVDSKLHVAVNNKKDSFEPSIWKPIDREAATRAIRDDMALITDLVDTLSLDERLFMGE